MINSVSDTADEDGDRLGYGVMVSSKISDSDYFIGHDGNAPGYRSIMFYQPDRKMTIAILTNYRGAKLYDVAKALFEALPEFLCGNKNKKEDKIIVCYNGNNLCVDRKAAAVLIERGAHLGGCGSESFTKTTAIKSQQNTELLTRSDLIKIYPNPASNIVSISFTNSVTSKTKLDLYDTNGKFIKNLYEGILNKNGQRKIELQTKGLSAGVYIVILQTENKIIGENKLLVTN